jgi:hypothetical protein
MKTFKEFSLNVIPRGHKMVKIFTVDGNEVLVTKNKTGEFNISTDNQIVGTKSNERDAIRHAKEYIKRLGGGRFSKGGASPSGLPKNKTGPHIPWSYKKKI